MPKSRVSRKVMRLRYEFDFRSEFKRRKTKKTARELMARNESIKAAFQPLNEPLVPTK